MGVTIFATVAATALACTVAVVPALASCIPNRSVDDYGIPSHPSHYVAWVRTLAPTTVGGVYSTQLNYEPYVRPETTGQNNTAEQVAMEQVGTFAIAEGGYIIFQNASTLGLVCEEVPPDGAYDFQDVFPPLSQPSPAPVVGANEQYKVNNYGNNFACSHQGVQFDDIPYYAGRDGRTLVPNQGDIVAETMNWPSQMDGTGMYNGVFADSHIYFGGQWQGFGAYVAGGTPTDQQCVGNYLAADTCYEVNGPGTTQFHGGSVNNGVDSGNGLTFGSNVFENPSIPASENQLNTADLNSNCTGQ